MAYVLLFAAGLVLGFALAYFFTGGLRAARLQQRLDEQQAACIKAETELTGMQQRLAEQRQILEESKKQLTDTFGALAAKTLQSNNASFLALAQKALEKLLSDARGDLGKRQEAIEGMVKPLAESLKAMDEARVRDMGGLKQQLDSLTNLSDKLKTETGNLVNALRAPQVRGRWGEVTLRRVVELAGMSEHCDFTEQVSVEAEGGRLRPDMIVHLPSDRDVVVDAKVSLSAYLEALEAKSEEERQALLLKHAAQVRAHMLRLSQKAYWDQFERAPEFVVMFIPGESFFSAAVEQQHELLEDGMSRRVVLATPTTLIALLWAVAYGWRQQQLAENAQEISELGRQLYERMGTLAKYVNEIGYGLDKAVSSYNQAVRSMEARLYPSARRFKELGAGASSEIDLINPVEGTTLEVSPPEKPEQ